MPTRGIRTIAAATLLGLVAGGAEVLGDGFETIILKDGQRVVGDVVAEKPEALYVDLGYDLLKIPRESIAKRAKGEEAAGAVVATPGGTVADPSGFFSTGLLRPAPVKELVAKFGEAVVSIETPSGKGSGFLINDQGYAITNAHVIEGETRISAILYQNAPGGGLARRRIDDVEIVAVNPFFDLALIKLPLPAGLKPGHAILGNGDDVNSGDSVFAVGNPLGLERTVTQGIVSNRSRNLEGQLYIQTDTAINPGNSGGPLFNQRGEVIGVTSRGTRADMADNLGFAIPVGYVKDFVRHREAFAFDKTNPNSGYRYLDPPRRSRSDKPAGLGGSKSDPAKAR
ncbi:S1C family serine protease [Paludisphaera rhizosphaerae]|uniref:S1C family serine protease n=1 Tax=Paludisphaera rhizosphaerae TaxID=2711216 RepID=UPI001F0ED5D8|nr:trypsin-like peptidase domain-containing protein [Paludisphaera rhizosphaerae]